MSGSRHPSSVRSPSRRIRRRLFATRRHPLPLGAGRAKVHLYDWTVTKDSGAGCGGAGAGGGGACKPGVAKCFTALVTKGVQGNLPTEHGGDWKSGSDGAGKFITQAGTKTYLRWDGKMCTNDFTSRMKIAIKDTVKNSKGSAATFEVGAGAERTSHSDSDRFSALSLEIMRSSALDTPSQRVLCGDRMQKESAQLAAATPAAHRG